MKSKNSVSMKKLYVSILFFFFLICNLNAQQWQWAHSVISPQDPAWMQDIDVDGMGNPYVLMLSDPSGITFHATNDTITLSGGRTYVAKYDSLGNILWVSAGSQSVEPADFAVDAAGNSYVTGYFSGTATFGISGNTLSQTAAYASDVFVVRLDNNGNPDYFIKYGDTCEDRSYTATFNADNVITVMHDDTSCSSMSADGIDLINKFDTNGNLMWSLPLTGDASFVVATNPPDGGYLIAGLYNQTDDTLVQGTSNSMYLPTLTDQAWTYVIKYTAAGDLQWLQVLRSNFIVPSTIHTDNAGNIYLAVTATDTVFYQSQAFLPLGIYTVHFFKLDATGNLLRHMSFPVSGNGTQIMDIGTDSQNNVFLFMKVSSSLTIDSQTLTFNMPHGAAVTVIKLDANLNYQWYQYASVGPNDGGNMVVTDSRIYIGVHYETEVFLNNSAFYFPQPVAQFMRNSFIASIENNPSPTGISENSLPGFSIYPNPTSGEFVVSSSQFVGKEITIYNLLGEKINSTTLNSKPQTLNLSTQPSGVYFVEMEVNGKREMRKVVLK
jgi:hypothetical protein